MQYLYKYMKIREDFFKDPIFRATQPYLLNDPFEASVTLEQIEKAHEIHVRNGANDPSEENSEFHNQSLGISQEDYRNLGIISLSEEPDNLLMWSHYADEHNGMVVQIKIDTPYLLSHTENNYRLSRDPFGLVYLTPKPVKYRKNRPSFNFDEDILPEGKYLYGGKKFNEAVLFTKANEWIYEKERRSIVELEMADIIICNSNKYLITECNKNTNIKAEKLDGGKLKIIFPEGFELDKDVGDESARFEIYQLAKMSEEDPIFFYRLQPSKVTGVFFGCYASTDKVKACIKNIQSNKNLEINSRIMKMTVLEDQFGLGIEKIDI